MVQFYLNRDSLNTLKTLFISLTGFLQFYTEIDQILKIIIGCLTIAYLIKKLFTKNAKQ